MRFFTTVAIANDTSLVLPGALAHRLQRRTAWNKATPTMPHRMQNPKWSLGAQKWPTGSAKVSTPTFLDAPVNFP